MITQETIKKEANEFADNFDSYSPEFGKIKRQVASFSFSSGANWAIQQIEKEREEIEAKSVKYEDELERLNSDLHKKDAIFQAQEEYIRLLTDELNEVASMMFVHGWKSKRVEKGIEAIQKIEEAKK